MSSEIQIPEGSAYAMVQAADTPGARFQAGEYAIAAVEVPGLAAPVPRFMFDLPWADDDADAVGSILAHLAAADDIVEATRPRELTDVADLCGRSVVIHGVQVRRSDVDDARWGAYLSLTVTVDGGEAEVVNTGAGQVAVTVWRLYCGKMLPAAGTFVKLGVAKKGRSQPLGFQVEGAF